MQCTETCQKYSVTVIFYYIFHIKPQFLKALFQSQFLFDFDEFFTNIYFFCHAKREFFFLELNIRLYDKNSESDYFFFLHQNQNIIFSNIGNQNIFFRKKP